MEITISVPDEFALPLIPPGQEPSRAALEALALEAYRQRRMTGYELRTLLGISSRCKLDALLKEHKIEKYTIEDFEQDLATLTDLGRVSETERSE
jgi:Uncharacterised protein family (UPF0175)